jgi:D-3-phosphoglycerate dehydrogenase / 2-oxoglutarate reductase
MSKPFRVLISDEMSPRAAEILAASPAIQADVKYGISPADLEAQIADYDGLVVRSRSKVTGKIIDAARKLRIIGRAGIGVDNIDVQAASRRGVIVENAPSGNAVTTAEHAICLLASLARHIPQATSSMKNGKWEKTKFSGAELMGKTLAVIGLGNIGRIVADRAQGLKMKVVAYDPFIGREAAARLGVELCSLDEIWPRADFFTIHTPLTDDTRSLVNAAAFGKMKQGVLVVNAARGGIVDEAALLAALESGVVAGAALDVFAEEPTPAGHPLVAHPRVICTPHLGASTEEAQEKVAIEVAEQFVAFFERGEIVNAVNAVGLLPEVRTQAAPWLELARSLGGLVAQLARPRGAEGFIDWLDVELVGEPGERAGKACVSNVLVGLLQQFMDLPVNEINASIMAADRGLEVSETRRTKDRDLTAAIAVRATAGDTVHEVKGTLYHIGDRIEARVVQIDDYLVEVSPRGHILLVVNQDRPGVIGAVGSALGRRGINVGSLHVGQDLDKGTALALWRVEGDMPEDALSEIRGLPLVGSARLVSL